MRQYNRIVCAFLALLMLISATAVVSMAEDQPDHLFDGLFMDGSDAIRSSVAYGDSILVLTRKAFYLYEHGDTQARYLSKANDVNENYPDDRPCVDILFSNEDALMGLNSISGQLYDILVTKETVELHPSIQLDLQAVRVGEPPDDYVPTPEYSVAYNGTLYVKYPTEDRKTDLLGFHLNTGKATAYHTTSLQGLCPYKDGLLLAASFDSEKSTTGFPELVLFDPIKDRVTASEYRFPAEVFYGQIPLFFDAQRDHVYVSSASALYALTKGNEGAIIERFATFGDELSSIISPILTSVSRNSLMVTFISNVYLMDLNATDQAQPTVLTVAGWLPDQTAAARALLELGDVVLQVVPPADNIALQTSLLTSSSQADILVLNSSTIDIQSIVKKGYVKSLSASPSISALSGSMLHELQNLAVYNGDVRAAPIFMNVEMPIKSKKAFDQISELAPTTLTEMIAFVQRYVTDIYPDHPEYKLFPFAYIQRHLKKLATSLYLDVKLAQDTSLNCEVDELFPLLQSIDDLDLEALDLPTEVDPENEAFYMLDQDSSAIALMQLYTEYSLNTSDSDFSFEPMLLKLDEAHEAQFQGNATFLAIPNGSQKTQKAMQFIEAYLKYLNGGTLAMLCPLTAVPIEDTAYQASIQEQIDRVNQYNKLVETSDESQKQLYKEMADYFRQGLDTYIARGKYCITQKQLQLNQFIMERVRLDTSVIYAIRSALKDSKLINQLLDGALSVEQFVNETNQKAKLVYLEMQ